MPLFAPLPSRRLAPLSAALATLLLAGPAPAAKPLPARPDPELPLLAANDPATPAGEEPVLLAPLPPPGAAPAPAASPSLSVTVNLIRQLVGGGVLPKERAEGLLKQAEAEAETARAQLIAERDAIAQAAAQQALAVVQANPGFGGGEPLPPASEASRVTYVPEVVRAQLRDEIKRDLATSGYGTSEKAVVPHGPEWVERFRLFADLRVRGEGVFFPSGNDNSGSFPNFNAINTGAPFNTAGTDFSPQLNADADRTRVRLRLRVGVESTLGEGFTAGLRLATGNTNSPTSPNQDLGLANNGQGGNFSKYAIWLDRAFLKYDFGLEAERSFTASIGRFENPFFSTEAIFDEDLGFDGFALQGRYRVNERFQTFGTVGAFPIFNTDFNFASNRPSKFSSDDKWLLGAQLGSTFALVPQIETKLAAAYYHFENVEGRLSDPFVPLSASDQGNTDDTRPSFAQKGNTYRPLRNITPVAENGFGTTNQFQYYGLATPFRNLALTGQVDFNYWQPFRLTLYGEYIRNLAFRRGRIDRIAVNNRGPNGDLGQLGSFDGGETAWIVGLRAGRPDFAKRGDWAAGISYRYLESDSVVDGFNDSDFGLGGTNTKGFSLWAGVALSSRVNMGVRWTSADEIAGPAFSVDIVQLDINARF